MIKTISYANCNRFMRRDRTDDLVFQIDCQDSADAIPAPQQPSASDEARRHEFEALLALRRLLPAGNEEQSRLASDVTSALGSIRARAGGRDAGRRAELGALASSLTALGYQVRISSAAGVQGQQADYLRNLRHEFIECTPPTLTLSAAPTSALGRDIDLAMDGRGVPAHSPAFHGIPRAPRMYVIDPRFREQFMSAHPTALYRRLVESVPPTFCGTMEQLRPLVELLAGQMVRAFQEQDMAIPPWRQDIAQLSKWRPGRLLSVSPGTLTPTGSDSGALTENLNAFLSAGATARVPGATSSLTRLRLQSEGVNTPRSIEKGFSVSRAGLVGRGDGMSDTDQDLADDDSASESFPRRTVTMPPGLPFQQYLDSDSGPGSRGSRAQPAGSPEALYPLGLSASPVRRSSLTAQVRRSIDVVPPKSAATSRFGIEARHGVKRQSGPQQFPLQAGGVTKRAMTSEAGDSMDSRPSGHEADAAAAAAARDVEMEAPMAPGAAATTAVAGRRFLRKEAAPTQEHPKPLNPFGIDPTPEARAAAEAYLAALLSHVPAGNDRTAQTLPQPPGRFAFPSQTGIPFPEGPGVGTPHPGMLFGHKTDAATTFMAARPPRAAAAPAVPAAVLPLRAPGLPLPKTMQSDPESRGVFVPIQNATTAALPFPLAPSAPVFWQEAEKPAQAAVAASSYPPIPAAVHHAQAGGIVFNFAAQL